ncbi:uncharacterized protein METZ01_LOCUS7591 [marine metagenome]|uniref:Uncharacterized protein n=1 Tax=marine metagenome TaxID=408172 RepID=A0A381NJP7_9ZZZZ
MFLLNSPTPFKDSDNYYLGAGFAFSSAAFAVLYSFYSGPLKV